MDRPSRRTALWVLAFCIAIALAGAWLTTSTPKPPQDSAAAPSATASPAAIPPGSAPAPAESADRGPAAPPSAPDGADAPPSAGLEDLGATWEAVDFEEIREAMPDNLYWKLAQPTDDLRVQREREEERERWNVEYGKVLSGTGTEQEVRAYYAQRQRMSADYVEFVSYVLDHYGDEIPERDVGLLELARRMHLSRLEEIPRKIEEALARKAAQDAAREAWLAEQEVFAPPEPE